MTSHESIETPGNDLWSPEYMTSEFAKVAIDSLKAEWGKPTERFGVYFLDGKDPRSSLGRMVELNRFLAEFENDADYMRKLYGEFEDAGMTELIVVVDHENSAPAATIRTVHNSKEVGCRILNDLIRGDDNNSWGLGSMSEVRSRANFAATSDDEILDIPTIAVAKGYGRSNDLGGVIAAVEAGVYQRTFYDKPEIKTWVCSLDRIPYQLIQYDTHNAFNEFEGVDPHYYYGSEDTTPLWCNVREYRERLKSDHPESYAKFNDMVGLEDFFMARDALHAATQ